LLVDNASRDESVAMVRRDFPTVEIILASENLRWAGGNNLALQQVRSEPSQGRQILLLNNDTIVPKGTLATLTTALLAEPRAWAATPRICFAHDPGRIWYDGGKVGHFSGWISHVGLRQRATSRPLFRQFVEFGTGCALLLTEEAVHKVGDLDENFFLYGEDVDFCLRLRARGGTILHVPDAVILHQVSAALGASSPTKAYLRSRSHVQLIRKHWPGPRKPLAAVGLLVYFAGLAGWHLVGGRFAQALALWQGVWDEVRGAPPGQRLG
jgi:GT2 family glycosyltransferase